MGCGGSKDEVAASNIVPVKSLQLNKSVSPNTSTIESEKKPSLPAVESAGSVAKEEAAALISKDSPDRYFSSRKDEEAIVAGNVLIKDEDRVLVRSVSEVEDSSVVKKEVVIVSDGEVNSVPEGPKSQDEKTTTDGGEDSKEESALTKEKGSEETVADKKN